MCRYHIISILLDNILLRFLLGMVELDQRYDVVRGLEPEVIVGAAEHHADKVIVIVIELVRLQEPVHRETQRATLLQRSGE